MILGDAVSKLDFCMDLNHWYFKVHSSVSVQSKSIILGQMINLNTIFHKVASIYRFAKIWNLPQFPAEFQTGQFVVFKHPNY